MTLKIAASRLDEIAHALPWGLRPRLEIDAAPRLIGMAAAKRRIFTAWGISPRGEKRPVQQPRSGDS